MKPVMKIVLGGTCLVLGGFDIGVALTNRITFKDIAQVDEMIEDLMEPPNMDLYGVPEPFRDDWESVSE